MSTGRLRHFTLLCAGATVLVVGASLFAGIVEEGRFRLWDDSVLRALRSSEDPARLRGPGWLEGMMRDVTALGSGFVLSMSALATTVLLLLRRTPRLALALTLTCVGGGLLNVGLKALAERERPTIVPHLMEASTTSFPSGHTLLAATIYLSVAGVLTLNSSRALTIFALSLATLLAVLVGFSRVFLGVHFPSDVLAGWAIGTSWSVLCILVVTRQVEATRAAHARAAAKLSSP